MKTQLLLILCLFLFACKNQSDQNVVEVEQAPKKPYSTPDEIYGQFFKDMHKSGLWADGKSISDATPLQSPEKILAAYQAEKDNAEFNILDFFNQHFKLSKPDAIKFVEDRSRTPEQHIEYLWSILERPADKAIEGSSLVPLPNPYIVPGGRFNEVYYWDSYFTMLGLAIDNKYELIENILDNFVYLIDEFGHIPNGNRTYFKTRSQPPFFSLMVDILARKNGPSVYKKYYPALKKEHEFWMRELVQLKKDGRKGALGHVVIIEDAVLNRYYDQSRLPRQEMYQDDLETLEKSGRNAEELFLDMRSACESGWDFSSRWFTDEKTLESINTSDILPVDLNCLLFHLELMIANSTDDAEEAADYKLFADQRKMNIQKLFWDPSKKFFCDYQFVNKKHTNVISAAGMYPLFFGIASQEQANAAIVTFKENLLAPGGVLSTPNNTGQQWDAPNGWAPLQWMCVMGLDKNGNAELAKEVAVRWTKLNEKVYQATGKFVEKYNVEDLSLEAGGGEYPVQDGFGWSNGVYLALKNYVADN